MKIRKFWRKRVTPKRSKYDVVDEVVIRATIWKHKMDMYQREMKRKIKKASTPEEIEGISEFYLRKSERILRHIKRLQMVQLRALRG